MPDHDTQQLSTEKIDIGPGYTFFGKEADNPVYLGRTTGETEFNYEIETTELETEEDGVFDQLITDDAITVTVPLVYTDVDTLGHVVPWGKIVEHGTDDEYRLIIPKAVGHRLSEYAEELLIRPITNHDEEDAEVDKSKDLTVHRAYPIPGPLAFEYSRDGQRVANIDFAALPAEDAETVEIDGTEEDIYPYFSIGDNTIDGTEA